MTTTNVAAHAPSGMRLWNRELAAYPEHGTRRLYLLLVVLITVALYYELYVGGGVATLMLPELKIPFPVFVYVLAAGNLLGAFASLLVGLADRFGRANLVVYGLLLVGLITLFWMPNVTTALEWGIASSAVVMWVSWRPGITNPLTANPNSAAPISAPMKAPTIPPQ